MLKVLSGSGKQGLLLNAVKYIQAQYPLKISMMNG